MQTSERFISQLLQQQEIRAAFWNCERLISARQRKHNRKLEAQFGFDILSAIPIEGIRRVADDVSQSEENRKRLANFVNVRWARLKAGKD